MYNVSRQKAQNILGARLAQARRRQGLTLAQFCVLLSEYGLTVQRQAISKWETGESVPNAYQLLAVCHALQLPEGVAYFSGMPCGLNEEGERKVQDYREDLIASGRYQPIAPVRFVEMPVSLLSASAGTGAFLDEGGFETVRVPADSVPPKAEFGVRIQGNSMEPVYQDRQLVWVQRCNTLLPGEVGIFLYDGEGYVKVYEEQLPACPELFTDSAGVLHAQPVLISYNTKYLPRTVEPGRSFQIIGRVLEAP